MPSMEEVVKLQAADVIRHARSLVSGNPEYDLALLELACRIIGTSSKQDEQVKIKIFSRIRRYWGNTILCDECWGQLRPTHPPTRVHEIGQWPFCAFCGAKANGAVINSFVESLLDDDE